MKKVLSLVLAFALVLGTFSMAFAATPSDVVGTDYEDAVERLMALGVVDGFTDGTIRPEDSITREQFAKLMVITLGMGDLVEYAKEDSLFVDVPATNWANGYINIASAKGLIKGYGDGTFGLGDEITYAQALTILVRALGYSDEGLSGKWPYNYIVKANELDITDDVAIVDGDATRGNVFMLLNNTLDCNLTKIDEDGNYVDKDDKLLSKLGTDKVTGVVSDFDEDDMEIVVDGDKLTVEEGFDFEAVFGLEITAWCDGDDVLTYTINDDVIYDAAAKDGDKVELINTEDSFEINKDAKIYIDGEDQDPKYKTDDVNYNVDYAKVVLNDDDEIIFFDGHNLNTLVVEDVNEDKEVVYSYGNERKVEDYTLVDKDGNTISIEDIEDGDIMFYNKNDDYAIIYNDSISGEIERVYSTSFKIDGDSYDIAGQYLDSDTLESLDDEALDTMKDEGDVEVFFNPKGDVVFVAGELGEPDTSSFYAIVVENTKPFETRGDDYHTFDLVKADGNDVSYDLEDAFINEKDDDDKYVNALGIIANNDGSTQADIANNDWETKIQEKAIVKVTVDEDGEVTKVEFLPADTINKAISSAEETSERYLVGSKAVNGAVVFDLQDADGAFTEADVETTTWGDFKDEYEKVKDAQVYDVDGDMAVIIVNETEKTEEPEEYTGLVTDLDKYTGEDKWDLVIEVNGEEMTFVTADDDGSTLAGQVASDKVAEDAIIKITVDANSNEVTDWALAVDKTEDVKVDDLNTSKKEFVDSDNSDKPYALIDGAVVFEGDDMSVIDISDLENGDTVTVYMDEGNSRYVQYVVRTAKVDPENDPTEAKYEVTGIAVDTDKTNMNVKVKLTNAVTTDKNYIVRLTIEGIATPLYKPFTPAASGTEQTVVVSNGTTNFATADYKAEIIEASASNIALGEKSVFVVVE